MASTISPSEPELVAELQSLRISNPTTGTSKLKALLLEKQPDWAVSEQRLKKVLQQNGLMVSPDASLKAGMAPTSSESGKQSSKKARKYEHPVSKLNTSIDVKVWTEKVEIQMIDQVRGKGLVALSSIEDKETIWKEDPWVLTSEW